MNSHHPLQAAPSRAATVDANRESSSTRRRAWLAAGALAILGLATGAAQAQPRDDRHRRGPSGGHRPPPPPARPAHRPRPPHGRPAYGSGPNRGWYRGDRVPPQYRSRQYVVNNWRAHRLSAPPRGYHWVQYGADYMLVAIATGVIAQLILAN